MTLNELYDRFIEQKYDLKPSTKVNYLYMYNHFVRPTFGKRLIGKIKYSDVKKFYYRIILDEEMKANTLDSIHTQLHPAFQMAVRDGLLRSKRAISGKIIRDMRLRFHSRKLFWMSMRSKSALAFPQKRLMDIQISFL